MKLNGISIFSGRGVEVSISGSTIDRVENLSLKEDAPYISPGFFDIQVNGYRGHDYSAPDLNRNSITAVVELLAAAGTARHIPTIVTNSRERIAGNLDAIRRALESSPGLSSAVPGIHLEGPYISSEDGPRGAHDPGHVRDPSYDEYAEWQHTAGGRVRMITLAPELRGALEFIERVSGQGVIAAIGHTGADPGLIREAVSSGARISTHLGNGSHRMIPRLKNYIWEQLAQDDLYAGIITDGYHLPQPVVKVFARAKGFERLILVSDAAVLGGARPGRYKWGNIDVEVFEDGHLGLAGTEFLAGAGHLLDRDIAQFMKSTGCSLKEAVKLCTLNPSKLFGLNEVFEEFRAGMRADITLFYYRPGGDRIRVLRTLVQGREIFRAEGKGRADVKENQD